MKVLIIDDEPLVRRSLEKIFLRSGHDVECASNGQEGLEKWREFNPDGVIIDVLMPGLSGPEVISEIKPDPKTAVILISAYSGDYDLDSVKQLGADTFIEKPFETVKVLVDQLQRIWELKQR